MLYRLGADTVLVIHLAFILFVLFGGLMVLRWRWIILLHVPAMVWGAIVEFFHLYCPLTPLENVLRTKAGGAGYEGGFIEHYLVTLIYPAGLNSQIQLWLGVVVVAINVAIYARLLLRKAPGAT
jgi:hypothetical protein